MSSPFLTTQRIFVIIFATTVLCFTQVAWSQCASQLLQGCDDPLDSFGQSAAICGDVAVVGTLGGEGWYGGDGLGSAYVFRRQGDVWTSEANLTPSTGFPLDGFGHAVATSGNWIIVTAPYSEALPSPGAAYAYEWNGSSWVEQAPLSAGDGQVGDIFGRSVSICGEVLVIGAVGDDPTGSAYVFRLVAGTWSFEQKLTASNSLLQFGYSVSAAEADIVVGNGSSTGQAHVFHFDGNAWIEEQELVAGDAAPGDHFGHSVAIHGDTAFVGAPYANASGMFSGSVSVFERSESTWQQTETLTALDEHSVLFGWSVSADDDQVVVGARNDDQLALSAGAAYVFSRQETTWLQAHKLFSQNASTNDLFGFAVSLSGNDVIVATPHGQGCGYNGTAEIFALDRCSFQRGDADSDGVVNSLADALFLLEFGFLGGATPPCQDAADCDDDGLINALADCLYLLQFGFLGGTPPPTPFPDCGEDPTSDGLTCVSSSCP